MGSGDETSRKVEHHIIGNAGSNEARAKHGEVTNCLMPDGGTRPGNVSRGISEAQDFPQDHGKSRIPISITERVDLVEPVEFDGEESNHTPPSDHRSTEDTGERVLGDGIRELKRPVFVFLSESESEAVAHSGHMEVQKFNNRGC